MSIFYVYNIHNREHIHTCTVRIERINVVGQSNEADIVHREQVIYILSDLDIVSSETAHILAEYQIDSTCLCILKQSLNTRSIEADPAQTVIPIDTEINTMPILVQKQMIMGATHWCMSGA